MSSSMSWARWATCALAASILVPALAMSNAQKASASGRSLEDCTSFQEDDTTEASVTYSITSTCKVPIDCNVAWRVVCAPDSKKRRAVHKGSAKFAFPATDTKSTTASADVCGEDSFAIDSVTWSCQPNKN